MFTSIRFRREQPLHNFVGEHDLRVYFQHPFLYLDQHTEVDVLCDRIEDEITISEIERINFERASGAGRRLDLLKAFINAFDEGAAIKQTLQKQAKTTIKRYRLRRKKNCRRIGSEFPLGLSIGRLL